MTIPAINLILDWYYIAGPDPVNMMINSKQLIKAGFSFLGPRNYLRSEGKRFVIRGGIILLGVNYTISFCWQCLCVESTALPAGINQPGWSRTH